MVLTRAQSKQLRSVAKTGQRRCAYLLDLPEDVLLSILARLDTSSRLSLSTVCSRLYDLTHSPRLGNISVSIERIRNSPKTKSMEALERFIVNWVKNIDSVECLWDSEDSDFQKMVVFSSIVPKLKTLRIIDRQGGVQEQTCLFAHIIQKSTSIESVWLSRDIPWKSHGREWSLEDNESAIRWSMWVLQCTRSSPNLRDVHVAGFMFYLLPVNTLGLSGGPVECTATSLSFSDICLMSQIWPQNAWNLKPSPIANITRLHIDRLYTFGNADISALGFCRNLERLKIVHVLREPSDEIQLSEKVSLWPLSACRRLTFLQVAPCALVNDIPIFPALKRLCLSVLGVKPGEKGLLASVGIIPMNTCTSLRIVFHYPTPVVAEEGQEPIMSLAPILASFPRLTRFYLLRCFPPINGVEKLSSLTSLVLDGCMHLPPDCRALYPTPPLHLIGSCSLLKKLSIATLDDVSVSALSFLGKCAALQVLALEDLPLVGDDVIGLLAGLQNLSDLTLIGLPLTTVASLSTCPSLCRLLLQSMPTLKDISAVAHSRSLDPHYLKVHSCGVSDLHVQRVQARLRRARHNVHSGDATA